ncbi:iron hydrogenase [Lipomyces oligophaga]|uniref:iron hydrogenase n=1 Tax=Lipomyces oligophaga TaxID=45792 RepID=UPI0034CD21BE
MSALLSAQDLNDFISPGLACINPIVIDRTSSKAHTDIRIDDDGKPVEVSVDGGTTSATALTPAQINLSDCLACSGCVTSAESVLISLQSHIELLAILKQNREDTMNSDKKMTDVGEDEDEDSEKPKSLTPKQKIFAVSISPQSRASLAAAFKISVEEVDGKLVTLFRDILGFKYVVGTGVGRQISLAYSAREVLVKSGRIREESNLADEGIYNYTTNANSEMSSQNKTTNKGPLLSSVCPGWICYVEKTHPHIIPYLSSVKSAQQIVGSLLKRLIARDNSGICESEIFHVSVMPCFDKKLEASRKDFQSCDSTKDVDCVITTKEVVQLLNDENIDFMSIDSIPKDELMCSLRSLSPKSWPTEAGWDSNEGSSSGGYLYHVLRAISSYSETVGKLRTVLKIIPGKNSDIVEYHLIDQASGAVLSKAAQVYGFRNIQNLVRKLKMASKGAGSRTAVSSRRKVKGENVAAVLNPSEYDYVEVMACPGGCINGGGQIGAPQDGDIMVREWKEMVEAKYRTIRNSSLDDESIRNWVEAMWAGPAEGESVSRLVSTSYHAVEGFDPNVMPAVLVGDKW